MNRKTWLLASAGMISLVAGSGAAYAQSTTPQTTPPATDQSADETTDNTGDIIVSARRRDEKLSDVAAAVSVIDAQSLADRGGAYDSKDLLADQPSVRFNNLANTITSEISIRASSTARATNGDPSIGLYRDGAYIGGGGVGGRNFTRLDFLDIGRVEVLRGTQGALYGRNAVGGAINIISARPEFDTSGFIHARYDFETDGKQAQGAFNFKLTDDIAVRFSGEGIAQTSGFFYNPNSDRYFDRYKGVSGRAQLRIRTGPLDYTFLAEAQREDVPNITFQVAIASGTPGFPLGFTQNRFIYPWNTPPEARQDLETYQGFGTLDLGGGITLSSTSHYRRRYSQYNFDADGTDAPSLAAARAAGQVGATTPIDVNSASFITDRTTSFNQDLHLNGTALDGRIKWIIGGDALILDSAYNVVVTRTPTALNTSTGSRSPSVIEYNSYSAYGSLGFDVTPELNVTGEARYTADDRSFQSRLFDRVTGVALGGTARVVNAQTKPDNVSYNATVAYKFGGGFLGYAKVGSSYRAGGFNANLGDPRQPIPIPAAYGNENSTTYELGLRASPGEKLYFALAGYYTDISNLIAQIDNGCAATVSACPVVATSFLTNAGTGRSYGVEAEFSKVLPVPNGQFRAALTGSYQHGDVTSGRYSGLVLPQVPDFLGSVNVNFRHDFIGDSKIVANILYSVQFGGQQELRVAPITLDSYDLLNLRLSVEYQKISFSVFSNNVTNEIYRVARDTTINRYNQPRTSGVEATFRW